MAAVLRSSFFRSSLVLGAGAAVFVTAWLGIELTRHGASIAALWLANAVALAMLVRCGRSKMPAIAGAGLAGNLIANILAGDALALALGLSLINLAEVLLVAIPLRHRFGRNFAIDNSRALGWFVALAAVVPLLSAAAGSALLYLTKGVAFGTTFLPWYASDALGLLMLTPLLLSLRRGSSPERWREPLLVLVATAAVTALVFSQPYALMFTVLPLLVLAAIRAPLPFVMLSLASVAAVAVGFTFAGFGPVAATPLDPGHRVVILKGFLVVAIFITLPLKAAIGERDRLNGALIDSERGRRHAAESAAAAKSRFLATMSHEIRTPMTGVLGMIDLLRSSPTEEERDRFLETLKQSGDLLLAVLDDVLDFSKIENGSMKFDESDFDFEELTQSTLDLFYNAASRKGLLITMSFDGGGNAVVRGDPVRLQQIVSNLISNAIKFTDSGRIQLSLVAAVPDGSDRRSWRLAVRDTGIGVAPDDQAALFDPFIQIESGACHRAGGTGLGLAISRRLVEAMGGEMGVDSVVGEGSTFWAEFSLADGDPTALPRRFAHPSLAAGRPLDVLVAEDNPINQMLIVALLRQMGHHPTCAANGRLAVEEARLTRFDCVLMDMQMPEMDGIAATRAIRSSGGFNAEVPIIALTADAAPERRRFYDNAGLTDFMTKPIDTAQLAQVLAGVGGAAPPAPAAVDAVEVADETAACFNLRQVAELRAALGPKRLASLIDLFRDECATRPPAIQRMIDSGDLDAARLEAHSLKGAALSIGATALAAAAAEAEQAAGKLAVRDALTELAAQAQRARMLLRNPDFLAMSRPREGRFRSAS